MSPGGNFPLLDTKISRSAELKVVRTGSKEPANGLLDVTVREATHTTAACILAAEARTPF